MDYNAASGREFGTVYFSNRNVASLVVAHGFAKVI